MHLAFIVSLTYVHIFAAAKLVSVPSDVELVYPQTQVNVNQKIKLGAIDNTTEVFGLQRNTTISLTWPNGTHQNLVTSFTNFGECLRGSTSFAGTVNATDIGEYTATWNFTYATSSDPEQASSSSCGPPPYSYQTIMLNNTFTVANLGDGAVAAEATVTTQLPEKPTGSVKATSSSAAERIIHAASPWLASGIALVGFIA